MHEIEGQKASGGRTLCTYGLEAHYPGLHATHQPLSLRRSLVQRPLPLVTLEHPLPSSVEPVANLRTCNLLLLHLALPNNFL